MMNYFLRTSICITDDRKRRLEECIVSLKISKPVLMSVLFLKGYQLLCKKVRYGYNVKYQPYGEDYEIMSVKFQACDREFMSACRDMFKFSVSLIFRVAIDNFLDEIEMNGIDPDEIAIAEVKKNSYAETWIIIRNLERKSQIKGAFEHFKTKMKKRR